METYIKGNYKRSIYTSDNGFVIGIFKIKETNEENLKEFINKTITFTEKERFGFMLIGVLYASRCNNLHGNVEARMNSEYADKETFMTYTDIYLLEYMITAIGLVMNGQMDEKYLVDLKNNCQLLIR